MRREKGKKSGRIHYHGILFNSDFTADTLREVWKDCLSYGGPHELQVDVEDINRETSVENLTRYVSKVGAYFTKEGKEEQVPLDAERAECIEVTPAATGPVGSRHWYVIGEVRLADVVAKEGEDAAAIAFNIRRMFRRKRYEERISHHQRAICRAVWDSNKWGNGFFIRKEKMIHLAGLSGLLLYYRDEGHARCPGMDFILQRLSSEDKRILDLEARRRAKVERRAERSVNYGAMWSGTGFTLLADARNLELWMWAAEQNLTEAYIPQRRQPG